MKIIIKLKNQTGIHHAIFAHSKFQVQLSGVTEWLVLNVATQVLIRTDKFWITNESVPTIMHFCPSEPQTLLHRTLGFCVTQFGKHWLKAFSQPVDK
jgi:hypothetical protein